MYVQWDRGMSLGNGGMSNGIESKSKEIGGMLYGIGVCPKE